MQGAHASDCISVFNREKITFLFCPLSTDRCRYRWISSQASAPCIVDTIRRAISSRAWLDRYDHKYYGH